MNDDTDQSKDPLVRRADEERERGGWLRSPTSAWLGFGAPLRASWKSYVVTLGIVAAATAIAVPMQRHFELSNLTMVYLLGVVVSAVAFGRGPAVAAAVLSVAVFDYVFVPPQYSFSVADTQYLVTFAVMLIVAALIGTLAAWLREELERSRVREHRTAALYRLNRDLAVRRTSTEIVAAAAERIAELLEVRLAVLMPDPTGALQIVAGDLATIDDERERNAARRVFETAQPVGLAQQNGPGERWLHLPLDAGTRVLGVLSVRSRTVPVAADPERFQLLRAFAAQTAVSLERCRLSEEADRARLWAETERTRNALLSSVSHDLRTPLAAITGAASSLRDGVSSMPEATRLELADTISEQAGRLNRWIGNLLEITRLESGRFAVRKEWHSLEEVVGAALARLGPVLDDRPIQVALDEDLPLVPLDDILFEQVIANLVENADKYARPGTVIEIGAQIEGRDLRFEVADRGPGLPPGEERRVFEKFYRGSSGSPGVAPGVGLGLAICEGIVRAHGGTIEAANRSGGGAVFTIRLPLGDRPPSVEAETLDSDANETPP